MGEDTEAGRRNSGSDSSSAKDAGKVNRTGWGWKKIAFFVFVLACVITAIVVPIVLLSTVNPEDKIVPKKEERIPCLLEATPDQAACEEAGCLYDAAADDNLKCFFPNRYGLGYEINKITEESDTGLKVSLKRLSNKTPYGKDAETLEFEATYYSDDLVGIRLRDPDNEYSRRPPVPLNLQVKSTTSKSRKYEVKVNSDTTGESLTVVVSRSNTGEKLFDTTFTGMVVSQQYLQWATKLPSDRLYGIGESNRPRFKHDMNYKTWALSARDQPPGGEENLYGVHPFYMAFDEGGKAHGVLLLNSHTMEVTTLPLPGLIFRALGGSLEFFIFVGPEAENVVQSYHNVIGKPYFPAYWGLGFQLSRYGYNSLSNMEKAIDRTRKYGIPLDVQHLDIDYMDRNIDFTYNKVNFAGLPQFITDNKKNGLKFITMIHPAFTSNETSYAPFKEGLADEVFVVWSNNSLAGEGQDLTQGNDTVMLGYLWPPGKAAFPDFYKENTRSWWMKQIKEFHKEIAFDGIWTDMNEPANFGTNEEKPFNWPEEVPSWSLKCPDNDWENPPYKTRAGNFGPTNRISDKTLCMVAALGDNKEYLFYEVHNLYGLSQAEPTYKVSTELDSEPKRGVVITRSTYPGSGQYAGHWLGDNTSEFPFIAKTFVGLLDFNMFGIPYVGGDICGYFNNATESLCRRWMVNGAFHPFSRNHNGKGTTDQDPGVWPSVAKASREALMIRYTLLPYLYNLFFRVHTAGGTVVRPLHHEFSSDAQTYDVDNQFMWGDALMFAPYFEENELYQRVVYLPNDVWYFYKTGARIGGQGPIIVLTDEEHPVIFVRGGRIIPTQRPAQNTHLSKTNPMGLIIALDETQKAEGYLYWDNGDQLNPLDNKDKYFDCHMMFSTNQLQFHPIVRDPTSTLDPMLSDIRIMGVQESPLPLKISVNGAAWHKGDWHYNEVTKELSFYDLDIPIKTLNNLEWTTVVDEFVIECPVSYSVRLEDGSIPEAECTKAGCFWDSTADSSKPTCSLPTEHRHMYTIGSRGITQMENGRGFTAHLVKTNPFTIHEGDFDEVNFNVWYLDNKSLRFNFEVPNVDRFVPPVPLHLPSGDFDPALNEYEFIFGSETIGEPFHFSIKRKITGATLFDTSIGGFFYADQFMSISTILPSKNIYGMGENMHLSFRHNLGFHTWPAFGRDQPPSNGNEDGAKNLNLYGSHPFYECVENDGNTHGVFLFSASALDYQLLPYPGITYRTISGMLDFYIFLGPKPEEVVNQYTSLIGRPALVPYWSLGFQLSKYGYENLETLKEAVGRTLDANIPLDVQYLDIDHMDGQAIFTVNENFNGLQEYIADTKLNGLRWIPILDPFVDTERSNYPAHEKALAADIYFKWPSESYVAEGTEYFEDYLRLGNSTAMLGYVWPNGKSAFPNFLDEAAQKWWFDEVMEWKKNTIDFDGLWIDMNEPANFDTNKEKPWNWDAQRPGEPAWSLKCPQNKWDDPPYVTKAALWTGCGETEDQELCHRRMSDKTICMLAVHGNETHFVRQYDVHNLYGWAETPITKRVAEAATGTRSVVITRSTFPGTGTEAGHWLGDNTSIWPDMHRSIIGMLEFNLFGIPYIGADVCGFFRNTTEDLCNRWMQLGSFYPFSRNHNTYEGRPLPQDPGVWPDTVAEASRRALRIRYRFLPYLYTLFYEAHMTGATVVRPLHHEFPTDRAALTVDTQFLWGPAFLISPILEEGAISRTAYLPDDLWYEFHSTKFEPLTGTTIDITPVDNFTVPLHLRGGYIFPTQNPEGSNTGDTRKQPMGLVITVGRDRTAKGSLYWDDGEAIDPIGTNNYHLSEFSFTEDLITNKVTHVDASNSVFGDVILENIEIWGYEFELSGITVDGVASSDIAIAQYGESVRIMGLSLSFQNDFAIGLVRNK